ncbi:MAG: MFS transporter [Pseudomonadota bacterium]
MDDGAQTGPRSEFPSARWFILFGVWLIYFAFGVVASSMAPLITPISADIGVDNTVMGFILGAWPLTYIVAAVPCGVLLDRWGARRMLLAAALLMAASAFARSLAETPIELLLAVALFGIGGPMISVGAPKVIMRLFEGKDRAFAMGIYVTGPYLGGLVTLALTNSVALPLAGGDWRGVMLIHTALVVMSGVIWLAISGSAGVRAGNTDTEAGKKFNLAAFAELVRLPEVRLIMAMSIGIFYINHGLNNWLPEILLARGFTPVEAGFWAAIPSAAGVLGVLVIPRLATPERRLSVMALLFVAALLASLLLQTTATTPIGLGLLLQGIARGSMMTVAILLLMEMPSVPQDRLGLAGGLFFTTAEIGGVLGPVTFGFLSDLSGGFAAPLTSVTLISAALLMLLAALKRSNPLAKGSRVD